MTPRFSPLARILSVVLGCGIATLGHSAETGGSADVNGVWEVLPAPGSSPSARYLHGAIYDPDADRMVLFGGAEILGDTWTLSLGASPAWANQTPASSPSGRKAMTVIHDPVRRRLIMFGGYDTDYRNDVWALSLDGALNWTQLLPTGTPPSRRMLTLAVYDPLRDRMIVFGGHPEALNDVWSLSLSLSPEHRNGLR